LSPSLLRLKRFEPALDFGGTEITGATIPEQRHPQIAGHTTQTGVANEERVESLPQPHRRSRFSTISCVFVKKACRGNIARRE
jgi:hypothetical protein